VRFMESDLVSIKGIGAKVHKLLSIASLNTVDADILVQISKLTEQHSEGLRQGKVFGYSVSEYAFATLNWLGTTDSMQLYDELTRALSDSRKVRIDALVASDLYKKIDSFSTVAV